ncbi:ABC transporter ATP-binding protein, partial [Halobacterium salinarum]|nr:ABC transporter ATP-binding protein [Halobacterium salinarum]
APPAGCRFSPRCEHATEACRSGDQPPLWGVDDGDTHEASCVYYDAEHDEGELADGEDATGGHQ